MSPGTMLPATMLPARHGVARVISKMGLASRTQAAQWVRAGRVRVNGQLVQDPEHPVRQGLDLLAIDGQETGAVRRIVVMLNKPRGLVTTRSDEQGRETVYRCFAGSGLPWLAPVGRLDKASEGLLLFCNDPSWAASVTDPANIRRAGAVPAKGVDKTYHVQINCLPNAALLAGLEQGVICDGERLRPKSVRTLRRGLKQAWLEIVLDEGRNRQIRRLLAALDVMVLRLVRVAVGTLTLGALAKGKWRELTPEEIESL